MDDPTRSWQEKLNRRGPASLVGANVPTGNHPASSLQGPGICRRFDLSALAAWAERINRRKSVQRDVADVTAAWQKSQEVEDPLFDSQHLHWRDHRIESLLQVDLGAWLLEELDAGRAFLPPPVGELLRQTRSPRIDP